ncbi:MAG: PIG-L deacetylase family protein [Candidatus Bathyarchaeia archaeon]
MSLIPYEVLEKLSWDEAYNAIVEVRRRSIGDVFREVKRVLCIQPHPDDTDIAAGGTVAWMRDNGVEVSYVTMTDGCMGTSDPTLYPEKLAEVRRGEQEEAARILGVDRLIWLDYRDSEFRVCSEARSRLISIIRRFKPDMVITVDPWLPYEAHPDHTATGILAAEASMFSSLVHVNPQDLRDGLTPHRVRFIAFYWSRKPNTFIDVTRYVEVKFKAISAHRSQFPGESIDRFLEVIKAYMKLMGKRIGVDYAEPFKVLPIGSLHCDIFAEDI